MTQAIVGYRLREISTGEYVQTWGGGWGSCPGVPNPVVLPNGDQVCAPQIGVDYNGYMLEEWWVDEPPAPVPQQVPMWTVRTVLQMNNIFDQAQAAIDASSDIALKNVWEYGNYAVRTSPAIASLGASLGMSEAEIDELFFAAAAIVV